MTTKPAHIGIIMDGNGRWAKERGLPRAAGHRAGVKAVRRIVRAVGDAGVPYLSLYAFSSENWSRPDSEVSDLMGLLKFFIHQDLAELDKNGVRVRIMGRRDNLTPDILSLLEKAEHQTAHNTNMNLLIGFNYGGRDEIARAAVDLARQVADGHIKPEDIDQARFAKTLDTAGLPDPDMIIRTSGEQRLSNFMPWQAAYAELMFVPCYWPDFDNTHLEQAMSWFDSRERRFGGIDTKTA